MNYDALRHFADSWGLLAMTVAFLTLTGWTFLPAARSSGSRAAMSIFDDEDPIDG
jgi:cytochrome c oxidase cbb3-type subunit 4